MSTITGTDQLGVIKAVRTDENGNLIVVSIDTYREKVIEYGDDVVGSGASLTLVSFTVPAGKLFYFKGITIGGEETGEFSVMLDTTKIALWRNSGSQRSETISFPEQPEAVAGTVIDIIVKNISSKSKQFEATIYGYTLDV